MGGWSVKYRLVFLVVVGLVVTSVRVMLLSVDLVVTLDPALAGESNPPHGVSVVAITALGLAEIVVVLILDSPVELVVGHVGVVDVLAVTSVRLAVSISGSGGDESKENDSDLENINIKFMFSVYHKYCVLIHAVHYLPSC
jgi:hypothetical protein